MDGLTHLRKVLTLPKNTFEDDDKEEKNQFLERIVYELAKMRKNHLETDFNPAEAINKIIMINGAQIYRTHANEYLTQAKKWLNSGLYSNAAVAITCAAFCILVVEGILEAVKTLTMFLEEAKQEKDNIRRNSVFLSAKEALKALITRDEDLLLQAELRVLEAPIAAEEDRLLLLRLIDHIKTRFL